MKKRIYGLFIVAVFFTACGQKTEEVREISQGVFLTDSLLQVISVENVEESIVRDEILLNGRVTFDPARVATVYPMFGGRVIEIKAEIGDYVRKGDVLARIRSGEVAELDKERIEGMQQLAVARRNLNSVQDLYESGMASESEFLVARQEMAVAEAEVKRLEEITSINHISGAADYSVVAPVSGFVAERNATRDMLIRPEEEALFIISGLEEVWVMADVYESDIYKIETGSPVRITTLAYRNREFSGKVDKISHILDPESKTMSVRIQLKNEDYLLKPGLFANVYVQQTGKDKRMIRVPAKSVIFENGNQYVVKVGTNEKLEKQLVTVYKQDDIDCYVSEGLTGGDRIVHTNALLVYNAVK